MTSHKLVYRHQHFTLSCCLQPQSDPKRALPESEANGRSQSYTGYTQKNGAVSKANKKFISHLTRAQRTPSAAATIQDFHALPAVRFSCLLRGCEASFQDGVAAGKRFLFAPF